MYELLQHVMVDSKNIENETKTEYCNGFLCNDDCALVGTVQSSIVHLLLSIENKNDMQNTLIKVLEVVPNRWASYFSQSQVINSL